jgi:hypothetical protein
VYNFLFLNSHLEYEPEPVLKICREFDVNDAAAFLLGQSVCFHYPAPAHACSLTVFAASSLRFTEKMGSAEGSLDLTLKTVNQRVAT